LKGYGWSRYSACLCNPVTKAAGRGTGFGDTHLPSVRIKKSAARGCALSFNNPACVLEHTRTLLPTPPAVRTPLLDLPAEHPTCDHLIGSDGEYLVVIHDHEKERQRRKVHLPRDEGRREGPAAIRVHIKLARVRDRVPALPSGIDGKRHRALLVPLKGEQTHQSERRRSAGRRQRPRCCKRPRPSDTSTGKTGIRQDGRYQTACPQNDQENQGPSVP